MKKTTTGWTLMALSMLTVIPFTTSCSSDKDIDLGELDKTIGIGSDELNLPIGSARDLKLADVLSLKEGDVIETLEKDSASYKAGDYQFKKGDDLTSADITVKEVHFDTFDPQEVPIDIPFAGLVLANHLMTHEYIFPTDGPQKINAFNVTGAGNDDVISLSEADLEGFFELRLGLSSIKEEVEFTQIDLYLPKFLEFDLDYIKEHHKSFIIDGVDFRVAGEPRADGRTVLTQDEKDFNVLTLMSVATQNDSPIKLKVKRVTGILDHVLDDDNDPEAEKGYMAFSKAAGLKLHGIVKMQLKFRKGQLQPTFDLTTTETRRVDPKISMDSGINVTHAEGVFDPDITINPSNVAIGDDVPDFLTDEKVNITMNNPTIKLKIESNINAKANIKPKMIAYFDDAKTDYKYMYVQNPDATDGYKFPSIFPNTSGNDSKITTSYIIITRNAMSDKDARDIMNATGYAVERFVMDGRPTLTKIDNDPHEVTNIAKLLSPRIPKSIDFEIEAQVDQETTAKVDLYDENDPKSKGGDYHITPSYEFIAPLALDPGSTIVYNDTIADWNKDIKDNEVDLRDGEIVITGNIHNNTPLKLTMEPVAIGVNKKEISDIKVTSNIVAKSQLGEGDDVVTPFEIKLTRNAGGSFSNLDGLAFKVIAESEHATPLNKDTQDIRIGELKLNLKGKLSIGLN